MAGRARPYVAELVGEPHVTIGQERIVVRHDDGRRESFALHDYDRLYAVPGLYELIVQERLDCRSPAVMAQMLGDAVDAGGARRDAAVVLDIAAGNGVSGEALAAAGLGGRGRYGTDIVPEARAAALRDRPGVYGEYRTLDLLALSPEDREWLRGLRADVACCVAPVGAHAVPVGVLAAVAGLLAPGALIGHLHEPGAGSPDAVSASVLGAGAVPVARRRYVHRQTIDGRPFEMDAVVWRLAGQAQ